MDPKMQVIQHGIVFGLGLGAWNIALRRYVIRYPDSFLAKQTTGGAFDGPVRLYVVSSFGQAIAIPAMWLYTVLRRNPTAAWWFGTQPQWSAAELLAYIAGYFAQDAIVNFADQRPLVLAHHAAGTVAAVMAVIAGGWLGLFVTLAMVYEVGSLSLGLSDLGILPRKAANSILIGSSLVPMVWILHGLVVSPPPDAPAIFNALVAFTTGLLRVREGLETMQELRKGVRKGRD